MPESDQLVVAQMDPYRQTTGGALRLRAVVDALVQRGPVRLVVVSRADRPASGPSAVDVPPGVTVTGVVAAPRRREGLAHALSSALRGLPRAVHPVAAAQVSARLRVLVEEEPGFVWVSRQPVMALVRPWLPTGVPTVLDVDDVESQRWADLAAVGNVPVRTRILARVDVAGWRAESRRNATRGVVSVVSNAGDASLLPGEVLHVPNPAVTHEVQPGGPTGRAVFVGSMTYRPNVDAARWLVRDVWPAVRASRPDAELVLVGRTDERVAGLADDGSGVVVTGEVASVAPHLDGAGVVAVPLQEGSGTSIKTIEAFAARRPVVSTVTGARGVTTPERYMAVADEPAAFAAALVQRMTDWDDDQLDRAERFFRDHHSPAAVADAVHRAADTAVRLARQPRRGSAGPSDP